MMCWHWWRPRAKYASGSRCWHCEVRKYRKRAVSLGF